MWTVLLSVYKPLVDFFLDLTSPTTKWLVHLELSEVHCSSLQFKAIAMMDNLESLYIKNAEGRHADFVQGKFDDAVVGKSGLEVL